MADNRSPCAPRCSSNHHPWPFSPIRFVYELQDTGPPIDRASINDPFAATGKFRPGALSVLAANLKKQRKFKIRIEARRHGFGYAGSAAPQGSLPIVQSLSTPLTEGCRIGNFVKENAISGGHQIDRGIPTFRVTVNDRLEPSERFVTIAHELGHIFCGHLGGCTSRTANNEESGWPNRCSLGLNEKEVEAEAVAYLLASRAGIVTGSAAYLKGYAEQADMAQIDLDLIVRAAARVERLAKIHYGSMVFNQHTDKSAAGDNGPGPSSRTVKPLTASQAPEMQDKAAQEEMDSLEAHWPMPKSKPNPK